MNIYKECDSSCHHFLTALTIDLHFHPYIGLYTLNHQTKLVSKLKIFDQLTRDSRIR